MSKTIRQYISQIYVNKPNLDYISKTGEINGSLLISIEKAMQDYSQSQTQELVEQNRELVEMLEKSLGALNDCCMVIDSEDEVFEHVKTLSSDINKALFNHRPKINVK